MDDLIRRRHIRSTHDGGRMLNLVLDPLTGFDDAQKAKVARALEMVHRVINSPEFEAALLGRSGLLYTRGMTHQQVLDMLRNGSPEPGTPPGGVVTVAYFMEEPRKGKSIGYTEADGVHTYRDFFDAASDQKLAGHIAHEALCHFACGFKHPFFNWFGWRARSVPYVVGDMVEDLA